MDRERISLIAALLNNQQIFEDTINSIVRIAFKDDHVSEDLRKKGNELYLKGKHDNRTHEEIFKLYCKSIAFAPIGTEALAVALGNRSAFLLHIKKYKECLQDIDRALKITDFYVLRVKLLCRKVECLKALNSLEYQSVLETIETCVDQVSPKDKNKSKLIKLLKKAKIDFVHDEQNVETEKQEENKILEIVAKKEAEGILNSVAVDYNEKYGRYLVATRDFQPGEIIFVENLYASVLNLRKHHTNCYNCLKTAWSGIPCEYCNWAMFCSEECKEEALIKYHDVECLLIPFLNLRGDNFSEFYHICIRMLVVGLKEAGSISELRAKLESVDKDTGAYRSGLKHRKVENNFKTIYALQSTMSQGAMERFSLNALLILIYLAKNSIFFSENFIVRDVVDLFDNDDAIFLGSLIVKLCGIKENNSFSISYMNDTCDLLYDAKTCSSNKCCTIGTCIALISSFMNHSCVPNASWCFREDQKIVIYASQPIKSNSQIFLSYACIYYSTHAKIERQRFAQQYNFICDCQACTENWTLNDDYILLFNQCIKLFAQDSKEVLKLINKEVTQFNHETINSLSKYITKAVNSLAQPSLLISLLTNDVLSNVFSKMYDVQRPSFPQCKNM